MRLAIFSSNRCNLECPYCAVAVNTADANELSTEQVLRGVDLFIDAYPGREHKVIFLGGEPLMYLKTVRAVLRKVQARRPGGAPGVDLFTNGTLLEQKIVDEISASGAELYLSLDGRRAVNDEHRVFARKKDSVFDRVMERLASVRWEPRRVNMVVHARTVPALVGNLHLFRGLGFSEINFQPDLYEVWTLARLAELRRRLREFAVYYERLIQGSAPVFVVPMIHFVLERLHRWGSAVRWWEADEDLALHRDGRFYPCPTATTFAPETVAAFRCGDLVRGVDWKKYRAFKKRVRAAVVRGGWEYGDFYHTPEEMYLYGEAGPLGHKAVFDNETLVSNVFKEEIVAMAIRLQGRERFRRIYLDRRFELSGTPS